MILYLKHKTRSEEIWILFLALQRHPSLAWASHFHLDAIPLKSVEAFPLILKCNSVLKMTI